MNSALKMNLRNDQLCPAPTPCAHYFSCVRLKEDSAVLHLGTLELMPWHDIMGQPWSSLLGQRLECVYPEITGCKAVSHQRLSKVNLRW